MQPKDTPAATCEKCGGSGKLLYRIAPSGEKIQLGHGVYVQDGGGSGTRACPCVRDLPAIDGSATWWETESLYRQIIPVPVGSTAAEVSVDGEVPRDGNGRRVHRVGDNRYYPTLVRVMGLDDSTLFVDDARALVAALNEAIVIVEKADGP